jgi:hypothetical protein
MQLHLIAMHGYDREESVYINAESKASQNS